MLNNFGRIRSQSLCEQIKDRLAVVSVDEAQGKQTATFRIHAAGRRTIFRRQIWAQKIQAFVNTASV